MDALEWRAAHAGKIILHVGLGCYYWMMVASVARFCRREPHTTARRVLLPYSVITIIVNTAFVVGAMIGEDSAHGKHPFMEEIKSCSVGDVFYRLFLTIPIVWNDALFMYRTSTLYDWKLRPMIIPSLLYITVIGMGIFSNLMCTGIPLFNIRLSVCTLLLLVPTAALNVLLVFMIVRKLLQARKSSILINDHTSAVRYVTIMNIVVESALAWVVAIVLELASDNIDGLMQWAQFFDCIFQIVSLLSPAVLLYRIAHDVQYTPPAVRESSGLWRTTSAWLYDVEKQMVHADKRRHAHNSFDSTRSQSALIGRMPPSRSTSMDDPYNLAPMQMSKVAGPAFMSPAKLQETSQVTVIETRA